MPQYGKLHHKLLDFYLMKSAICTKITTSRSKVASSCIRKLVIQVKYLLVFLQMHSHKVSNIRL